MDSLGKFITILMLVFVTPLLPHAEPEEGYTKYVNGITARFTKEMKQKYGLVCTGSGGRMHHQVEEITLFLDCYHKASVEEARTLYITIVDRLIEIINDHEKIRPYLKQYPFPPEGAGIFLSFQKKDGSSYLDGSVASISQGRERKLYYDTAEKRMIISPATLDIDGSIMFPESEYEDIVFIDLLDEPYADAERIVHAARGISAQ